MIIEYNSKDYENPFITLANTDHVIKSLDGTEICILHYHKKEILSLGGNLWVRFECEILSNKYSVGIKYVSFNSILFTDVQNDYIYYHMQDDTVQAVNVWNNNGDSYSPVKRIKRLELRKPVQFPGGIKFTIEVNKMSNQNVDLSDIIIKPQTHWSFHLGKINSKISNMYEWTSDDYPNDWWFTVNTQNQSVVNLKSGIYSIRRKETSTHYASEPVKVMIPYEPYSRRLYKLIMQKLNNT